MIGRSGLVLVVCGVIVGSCAAGSRTPESGVEAGEPGTLEDDDERQPCAGEPPLSCTMAGQACPSTKLPRFSASLDAAGWTRLRALADQGVVAIVLGDRVELVEGCRLPGRYHEAAAAAESPGRAWSSDRLVFLPDEPEACERATHFVASFAIRGELDGEAIALPLPCPPRGRDEAPIGCIGAGLDDAARMAAAKPLWDQAKPLLDSYEIEGALPLVLDLAALLPEAWGYMNVRDALRPLDRQEHGGCLWLSEARFAVHALSPDESPSMVNLSNGRISPSHEYRTCDTQPSLLTCFPERFVPGVGDNCW